MLVQPKIPFKRKDPPVCESREVQVKLNYVDSDGECMVSIPDRVATDLKDLDDEIQLTPEVTEPNLSYVEQFEECLNGVLDSESFLVDDRIAGIFLSLPLSSKEIYIKLFNRIVRWIPISKLCSDCMDCDEVFAATLVLLDKGFVDFGGPTTFMEWENIATKNVLEEICKDQGIKFSGLRKSELAAILLSHFNEKGLKYIQDKIGPVVMIDSMVRESFIHYFIIYQRLTNWPADEKFMLPSILSNLKLDNISRKTFVKIDFTRCSLVWPSQECFVRYLNALKLGSKCDLLLQSKNQIDWLKVIEIYQSILEEWSIECKKSEAHITGIPWLGIFTPGWVQTRIVSFAYQAFFKLKRYSECGEVLNKLLNQRLFRSSKRGRWYDEYAKILERYVDVKLAKRICKEALSDRFVMTGHRHSILKRLERLCKKSNSIPAALWGLEDKLSIPQIYLKGTRVIDDLQPNAMGSVKLLGLKSNVVSVEQFALEHYVAKGWKGFHSENSIILTLFGILFWEALFDPTIPGVFNSPFQIAPLDLSTEFFYESRKETIDLILLQIREGYAAELIFKTARRERPNMTACIGVNWKRFKVSELVEIVQCIGGESLANVCGAFCKTFWAHLGGVPDLCLWNSKTREFKLAEVKSENDRLSNSQIEWLQHLKSWNVCVETIHIKYPSSIYFADLKEKTQLE